MKYALRYYSTFDPHVLDTADEVIIKYTHKTMDLIDFIQEHKNQRVVVNIAEYDDLSFFVADNIEILEIAKKQAEGGFAVLLTNASTEDKASTIEMIVDHLKSAKIDFFFSNKCTNLAEARLYLNYGVRDIYVSKMLGFDLKTLRNVINSYGRAVNVRAVPNVLQPCWDENAELHTVMPIYSYFFIRPEDTQYYEEYIDIFEFGGDIAKQHTYEKVYRSGVWVGDLRDLIVGTASNISVYNQGISLIFGKTRTTCKLGCMGDSKCQRCPLLFKLAATMKEKGYRYKMKG